MKILEKIFSVKNNGSFKVVTIFGLKLKFSSNVLILQKKVADLEKKVSNLQNQNYARLLADYKYNGFSDELLRQFKNLERSRYSWSVESHNLWLLYILILLENNLKNDVEPVVNKYIAIHKLKAVENFPIVANYFHKLNYTNERIEKSSIVYEKIKKAQDEKVFENLIKGKTIAIVGNGPYEIGKGRGREIDSHDVVIRFNEFHIKGFEEDYGSKTTVWVNYSANPDYLKFDKNIDYELNMWCFDVFYYRRNLGLDNLFSTIDKPLDIFGVDVSKEIYNKYGYCFAPTTGMYMIMQILKLRKSLKDVDFYGFSFLNPEIDFKLHYYNDKKSIKALSCHNINAETVFLKKIIEENYNE